MLLMQNNNKLRKSAMWRYLLLESSFDYIARKQSENLENQEAKSENKSCILQARNKIALTAMV